MYLLNCSKEIYIGISSKLATTLIILNIFLISLFVSTLTNTWSWVVHILQIYIQTAHTVQMTPYKYMLFASRTFKGF